MNQKNTGIYITAAIALLAGLAACPGPDDPGTETPGPLTAAVSFRETEQNSSQTDFDLDAWSGGGENAAESWTLRVTETSPVYFAVAKTAAQTISPDGNVPLSQANDGTVDGSAAGPELSVFTLDAAAWDLLLFEGGDRSFTLAVSEAGHSPRTITVTLRMSRYETGVAAYKVTRPAGDAGLVAAMSAAEAEAWARSGSLTRVSGMGTWQMDGGGSWSGAAGTTLLDALAWVDQNAQDGEEYLIRLEKNEVLPKTLLSCGGRGNVMIRLRGAGGAERVVTHDGSNAGTVHYGDYSSGYNLINVGTGLTMQKTIVLSLERDLTLSLEGITISSGTNSLRGIVSVDDYSRLVMLAGSKLTGNHSNSVMFYVISTRAQGGYTTVNSLLMDPGFFMFGGEISGNTCIANGLIYASSVMTNPNYPQSVFFVKKGGSISGNFLPDGATPNNVVSFGSETYRRTIVEGREYSVPPLPPQ
jgi:hypothetical protein